MPDFHAPGGPSVVHALGRPSLLLTCTLRELGVLYGGSIVPKVERSIFFNLCDQNGSVSK